MLDFIGESPYTRRVTDVSPCFEGGFLGQRRHSRQGRLWLGCRQGESGDHCLAAISPLTSPSPPQYHSPRDTTKILPPHSTATPRATRAVRHRPARHLPLLQRPVVVTATATHRRLPRRLDAVSGGVLESPHTPTALPQNRHDGGRSACCVQCGDVGVGGTVRRRGGETVARLDKDNVPV